MSPYTENAVEKKQQEPSGRLLEHPYYQVMVEHCRERGFNISGSTEASRKDIHIAINFYDDDKHNYKLTFRLYEVETTFFCVGVVFGNVTPETRQKALQTLNHVNEGARTLYRAGMDEKDSIALLFRGEAGFLNLETFKGYFLDILGSAVWLRGALSQEGIKFVQNENQGASNESAK